MFYMFLKNKIYCGYHTVKISYRPMPMFERSVKSMKRWSLMPGGVPEAWIRVQKGTEKQTENK